MLKLVTKGAMTHLHFSMIAKPKWLKPINRSRIMKFLYEAYLGIQSDDSIAQNKSGKKEQAPGMGERL